MIQKLFAKLDIFGGIGVADISATVPCTGMCMKPAERSGLELARATILVSQRYLSEISLRDTIYCISMGPQTPQHPKTTKTQGFLIV